MITALMQASRDFVRAKIIADPQLPAALMELSQLPDPEDPETLPAGSILYEVRGDIEETPLPEERYAIYVKVREVPGDLERLKDWMLEVSVGTPIDIPETSISMHSELEQAVDRVWDKSLNPTAEADLAAEISAKLPGWTGGGFHAQGWTESREGTELLPVYEVKAGVMKG